MKTRKILITILSSLIIVLIIGGIWILIKSEIETKKEEEANRNINVEKLNSATEKKIGTISYPGGKIAVNLKEVDSNYRIVYKTTDSPDGATEIYYQDLLSRYKSYDVSKKTVSKDEATNGKANILTCSGVTGKISITVWGKKDGLTQVEIETTKNFK